MKINNTYCIDCVKGMEQLPDSYVDLTVTSPPYNNLRKYKGFSFDFTNVARQLFRITKMGGVVVWNVKDQVIGGSETGTSFSQALYFMGLGFRLHDTMIYLKDNPIPQLKTKRYTDAFEYMFVLSKGQPKTCNYLEVPTKLDGRVDNNYRGQMRSDEVYVGKSKKTIKSKKIKTNVWTYSPNNGIDRSLAHPAQFPEQLAHDHIYTWSNVGDLVLDPFMGSGTTAKMAKKLGRNFIGFEISQEYVDIANKRISVP